MENKTEHIREKARIFLTNNIKAFIKDIYDNYHFCLIKEVWKDWLIIEHFKGSREGEILRLFLIDIKLLEEYKEKGDLE